MTHLTQAQVNQRMQPWGDAEFRRFAFRTALFNRRGVDTNTAERLADRLALRDQEKDDRRICLECLNLQRSGHCFAAAQGRVPNTAKRHQPVQDLLARCEAFEYVTPWPPN
jgi:hypothetical protein